MRVYIFTDKGKNRSINEDSLLLVDKKENLIINQSETYFSFRDIEGDFLCLVSDGMGGHDAGELASRMVCDEFKKWFELLPLKTLQSSEDVKSSLSVKFLEIDRFLNQEITTESRSPGATVVGMLFLNNFGIFIFHAGDSRAYRNKGGILQQYTQDHNDYQMRVQNGLPGDVSLHVGLTNCLGGGGRDNFLEVKKFESKSGDFSSWILCSDGIHGFLNQDELEELTSEKEAKIGFKNLKNRLDQYCNSPDNYSIIAIYQD